ncbi:MAG: glycosyltransferase family 2 protein [Fibrobacteres bacterium]|nr:glycosyltransferase family 2 protein [Fibrobacterota bacterium]
MKSISIVIPLHNEEESLPELHAGLASVLPTITDNYEIIFINDGSRDNSQKVIQTLAAKDQRVKSIAFRKNYGKAAALAVGFKAAQNDIIISMDADLQDDPTAIPDMVKLIDQGYDLVSGWKKKRYDPLIYTLPSRVWNGFTSWVAGVKLHDFNCGFKAYRAETAKCLDIYGERHRYLPVFAHWNGFKVTEMAVPHHARKYGSSKYGIDKFVKGTLDLLTIVFLRKYLKNPLHFFGALGILFFLAGSAILGYFGAMWAINGKLHIRPLMLLGVGSLLMGVQLFSIGLICELIAHTSERDDYLIAEKLNLP